MQISPKAVMEPRSVCLRSRLGWQGHGFTAFRRLRPRCFHIHSPKSHPAASAGADTGADTQVMGFSQLIVGSKKAGLINDNKE